MSVRRLLVIGFVLALCAWASAGRAEEALWGTGTAFVVTADGWLVTCAHLLKEAAGVTAVLGGREYEATIVARDENRNVALLKIAAANLSPLPLLPSVEITAGEPIQAVGYPLASMLGSELRLTRGAAARVSGRGPSRLLSLNVSVGAGADGQPVLDARGVVIGMLDASRAGARFRYDRYAGSAMVSDTLIAVMDGAGVAPVEKSEDAPPAAPGDRVSASVALLRIRAREGAAQRINPADGAVMVLVPGGEFLMGSAAEKIDRPWFVGDKDTGNAPCDARDETPQRRVYLDGYWMYKYEVTVAQYRAFCADTGRPMPALPPWSKDDHPMINVTWQDGVDYARWAGAALPTEAQWEKAARGANGQTYPWGNADRWFGGAIGGSLRSTEPVGIYYGDQSPYGVMDLAGNVQEWCADWYDAAYYGSAPPRDPRGPAAGSARVVRGAMWLVSNGAVDLCRGAFRASLEPDMRNYFTGFRCAAP